jgi:hypothetical protein
LEGRRIAGDDPRESIAASAAVCVCALAARRPGSRAARNPGRCRGIVGVARLRPQGRNPGLPQRSSVGARPKGDGWRLGSDHVAAFGIWVTLRATPSSPRSGDRSDSDDDHEWVRLGVRLARTGKVDDVFGLVFTVAVGE